MIDPKNLKPGYVIVTFQTKFGDNRLICLIDIEITKDGLEFSYLNIETGHFHRKAYASSSVPIKILDYGKED